MNDNLFLLKLLAPLKNPNDKRKTLVKKGEYLEGFYEDGKAYVTLHFADWSTGEYVARTVTYLAPEFEDCGQGRRRPECNHGPAGECMVCAYEKLMSI